MRAASRTQRSDAAPELGRLYDFQKEDSKAKAEYSLLLDSFNKLELSPNRGKGKVSLQSASSLARERD